MRYLLGRLLLTSLFGLLLFASAGRTDWVRAWVYLGAVGAGELISAAALRAGSPEILERRGRVESNPRPFDRVFIALWLALAVVTPVVAGLDAGRRGDGAIPLAGLFVGLALLLLSYLLATWAMAVNRYFELTVRIQSERAHQVVSSGPYRIVRHPGYLAAIVGGLATPLVLGSLWAFAPVVAGAVLFVVRTSLEDRILRQELDGYREYAASTRHRLLPWIW